MPPDRRGPVTGELPIDTYFSAIPSGSKLGTRTRSKENCGGPSRPAKRKRIQDEIEEIEPPPTKKGKNKLRVAGNSKTHGHGKLDSKTSEQTPVQRSLRATATGLPTPQTMTRPVTASTSSGRPVAKTRDRVPKAPPQAALPRIKRSNTAITVSAGLPSPKLTAQRTHRDNLDVAVPRTPTRHRMGRLRSSSSPPQPFNSPRHRNRSDGFSYTEQRSTPQSQRIVPSSQKSVDEIGSQVSPTKTHEGDENPFVSCAVQASSEAADLGLPHLSSPLTQSSSVSGSLIGVSSIPFKVPLLPLLKDVQHPPDDGLRDPPTRQSQDEIVPSSQSQYMLLTLSPVAVDIPPTRSGPNTPSHRDSQESGHSQFEPTSQLDEIELDMAIKLEAALSSSQMFSSGQNLWTAKRTSPVRIDSSQTEPDTPPVGLPTLPPAVRDSSQTKPESPSAIPLQALPAEICPTRLSPSRQTRRIPVELPSPQKSDGSVTEPESEPEEELMQPPSSYRNGKVPQHDPEPEEGLADDGTPRGKLVGPGGNKPRALIRVSHRKLQQISRLVADAGDDEFDLDEAVAGFSEGSSMHSDAYMELGSSLPSAVGDFLDMLQDESQEQ
ncbi:hypothetical protein BV25DRAFT_1834064 [Artomyces pyxidatus]|uniref:Uncharacterized protein n=1 Tax=Artomyces pyxidatus TaxID=48021 RepID=A0ACB8TKP7_9AGAM|nr:hypothetical protein BV25DRAFT_1834064 [Artomyces pyxidatus]